MHEGASAAGLGAVGSVQAENAMADFGVFFAASEIGEASVVSGGNGVVGWQGGIAEDDPCFFRAYPHVGEVGAVGIDVRVVKELVGLCLDFLSECESLFVLEEIMDVE